MVQARCELVSRANDRPLWPIHVFEATVSTIYSASQHTQLTTIFKDVGLSRKHCAEKVNENIYLNLKCFLKSERKNSLNSFKSCTALLARETKTKSKRYTRAILKTRSCNQWRQTWSKFSRFEVFLCVCLRQMQKLWIFVRWRTLFPPSLCHAESSHETEAHSF